jgi:phosphoenolpyruvate carboxykinase (GTP)
MGDYFQHWLKMGRRMTSPPKIFHVNWFRTDEKDRFLWPGFGENLRVLEWILDRCNDKVGALKTPIGYTPYPSDIDLTGLDVPDEDLRKLLSIDKDEWLQELKGIKHFFQKFKKDLPVELWQEYEEQLSRLKAHDAA